MAVVSDLVHQLGLSNVDVVCARAEAVAEHCTFDFMLGRAVSAIPTFLGFSSHLMVDVTGTYAGTGMGKDEKGVGRGLLYLKGGDFEEELTDAGMIYCSTALPLYYHIYSS